MRRYPGVVIGIVKSLDDPKKEGRIQVEFPWLAEGQRSAWSPVATPLAGNSRGMFFMPELEDEVLLSFEHGDFNHPFVVGFLWNGTDLPPESDNKNRIILTPGGHMLRFEDGNNTKKIAIKSSNGHEIILDDTSTGQKITLKTKGSQIVVLDDTDQSIQLQGGGRILALRGGQVRIS
jgi:uncharacterized protein involved in type VI secretion and phage assembly